jgi:hypothetical protein
VDLHDGLSLARDLVPEVDAVDLELALHLLALDDDLGALGGQRQDVGLSILRQNSAQE